MFNYLAEQPDERDRYSNLAYWDTALAQQRSREGAPPYVFVDPDVQQSAVQDPSGQGSRMAALPEVDPLCVKLGPGHENVVLAYRRLRLAQQSCMTNFEKSGSATLQAETRSCTNHHVGNMFGPL